MSDESTYTSLPATVPRDALRLKIPDMGPEHFYLSNSNLDYILTQKEDTLSAAIEAVSIITGLVAPKVKNEHGRTMVEAQQEFENWRQRLGDLKLEKYGNREGKEDRGLVFEHENLNDIDRDGVAPYSSSGPVFNIGDWDRSDTGED